MIEPAPGPLQRARHAFRDAKQAMAAAVLAADRRATVAAAWTVLRAADRLRAINACPSARDRRTRVRWRRWALAALRRDPPDFGLLRRAVALQEQPSNAGEAGPTQEQEQ